MTIVVQRTCVASVTRAVLLGCVILLVSVGCSTNESLTEQYRAGDGKNYVAGDGTITEIAVENRGRQIEYSGTVEDGASVASTDYRGRVVVMNFWYAGCAPCRAEAPELQALWEKYQDEGVVFLGVNVRDEAGTAEAFAESYGITYPSILDAESGAVQLAFSGTVAPNAVPTTLIIDRQGRVASRILGQIPDPGILDTLISSVLSEKS